MKVVIAIDSFKGSLSTYEAGNAAAAGVLRCYPDAEVIVSPLADGGEGSSSILTEQNGGVIRHLTVKDPLGRSIVAEYGIIKESGTAVIEMASAAGITLITPEERNPLVTTTYGVGEMISDAIDQGCRRFIVGIGGSATNDCGIGMLQALGFEFTDVNGNAVGHGAGAVADIANIKTCNARKELADCSFTVACDVQNPLCGENGCSAVYGPQKGATKEMIQFMDNAISSFDKLSQKINPNVTGELHGSGAAGGLGYAFLSYLNGSLRSGIELMMAETHLEEKLIDADFVITGEGRLDSQSVNGKTPVGVASIAKKHGIPVIAVAGCVRDDANVCNSHGIDAYFPILKAPCSLDYALSVKNSKKNLSDTVEQIFRLIKTLNR